MTPFTYIEFVAFVAIMALFAPLTPLARFSMHERPSVLDGHSFYAPAYALYIFSVLFACIARACGDTIPKRAAWRPATAIVVHALISAAFVALAVLVTTTGIGTAPLRLGSMAAALGVVIHTACIPLGMRSPWAPRDPTVVNVELVRPGVNANYFLTALFLLVVTYHVIVKTGPLLDVLHSFGTRLP